MTAARITPQGKAYVEWVTGLDTEPSVEGAFISGWRARDAEIQRLLEECELANQLTLETGRLGDQYLTGIEGLLRAPAPHSMPTEFASALAKLRQMQETNG